MAQMDEYDDCFEIELNITKVQNIFFIDTHTLLLLHVPKYYTIVEVVDRWTTKILKQGQFGEPLL